MSNISTRERELLDELKALKRRVARLEALEHDAAAAILMDAVAAPSAVSRRVILHVDTVDRIKALSRRLDRLEALEFDGGPVILRDGITAPSAVSGQAILYVDAADGDLKVVFGDSTVKLIVADT